MHVQKTDILGQTWDMSGQFLTRLETQMLGQLVGLARVLKNKNVEVDLIPTWKLLPVVVVVGHL